MRDTDLVLAIVWGFIVGGMLVCGSIGIGILTAVLASVI